MDLVEEEADGKLAFTIPRAERQAKPKTEQMGFAERTHLCLRTYAYQRYKYETVALEVLQESLVGLLLYLYLPAFSQLRGSSLAAGSC